MIYKQYPLSLHYKSLYNNTKIMESTLKTNTLVTNAGIITLQGYYRSLPDATYPKSDFIRDVATKCCVTETTVRNWIKYGMKPNNPEHVKILSEMTGINSGNLWND